jgi:CRP-like cAMP-binding protein
MRGCVSPEPEHDDEGRRELDLRVGFGLFASETQLDSLLSIARRVDVEPGQVLYTREEPLTTLFQVIVGQVELEAPELPIWRVRDGGAVGLVDFALGRAHTRTAIATLPSQLIELDAADYRDYLEDNFEVCHRIVAQLSGRLMEDMISEPGRFLSRDAEHEPRTYSKVEIPLVERLIMMSRMPAFRGTSTQALANLAQSATEQRYAPGEIIAPAGAMTKLVSLLVEGTIELVLPHGSARRTGRDFVAHLEELALGPRSTTAIAVTPATVLQIERDDLVDRIEEHFDLAMTLLAFVAGEQQRVNEASSTGNCRVA